MQLTIRTTPDFIAEKEYVFSVLLGEILGVSFVLETRPGPPGHQIVLPNGAQITLEDHFFHRHTPENYRTAANLPQGIFALPHPFAKGESLLGLYGRPHLQTAERNLTCGLDLVASAFFMLTRWEEHVRPERDAYGRFPAQYSLAFREGFLDRPIVNEYAGFLEALLLQLGWPLEPRKKRFRLHLSHDVDHPRLWWTPADRLRTLGGSLFQRKNGSELAWWLGHAVFRRQDPYDIFDEWMTFSEKHNLVSHFNFLGDRPGTQDCPYRLNHPFVLRLLNRIAARGHIIGFHPSREAWADAGAFQRELTSLRKAAPQPVVTGRQHYLCFQAPETWRRWAEAGMTWDSTLGYPEAEGFRCGICCEFQVFDALARKRLPLREKPLIAMDITLAQYRKYTSQQAFERLASLRTTVRKHGGEFVLLWHNSSWNTYFWAPWRPVYREFVATS